MESCQTLSIESFSYRWLVNIKPSLESLDSSRRASLDASDEASFIEMDPRMPPSKRFFTNSQDFKFDFPTSESPLSTVDADELFSNGYLMPLIIDHPLKIEAYDHIEHTKALPPSSQPPKLSHKTRCSSLRRCRALSRRIILKYLEFFRPLYRKLLSVNSRGKKAATRFQMERSFAYSAETSPKISVVYPTDDWRRSCDSESSIYEAVLHCKRSFGK